MQSGTYLLTLHMYKIKGISPSKRKYCNILIILTGRLCLNVNKKSDRDLNSHKISKYHHDTYKSPFNDISC